MNLQSCLRNKRKTIAACSSKRSFKDFFKCTLFIMLMTISCVQTEVVKAARQFANEWAVEIEGGNVVADTVALNHGFINHGKILKTEDFYLFSHPKLKKRSLEQSLEHHESLISHPQVKWAEQQAIKRRVKRDLDYNPADTPNDPKWSQMWYLLPTAVPTMNVQKAWQAGFTGKNISVTILDDGIEHSHPDLHQNYDPLASGDINSHDNDPTPRLNPTNENRHGTRCAGEVAAVANNNICSIGIAYNGKIGGVRMLDGQVTDAVEAASIGFNPDHVDIYSASWGPDDDGRTVDGPAKLARKAFVNGVTEGRGGKGSIFVWASGNGGRRQDDCNCDGYTDSIYTLSISSTTQRGTIPWYSESCSSTLASTYSSGSQQDRQIVSTDLRHSCTSTHTGTSASAPLAAAICALALEANPDLTWRDMQHLVVQTAKPEGLDASDWVVNGVGRKVSHAFGYGLMDAYAMVTLARNWTLVPPQRRCLKSVISADHSPRVLPSNSAIVVPVEAATCDNEEEMIERLEHVQAELTLSNERRGDLAIYLTAPSGTRSRLLGHRRDDLSSQGFDKWAFMSTHSWDENPRGRWRLELEDRNQRTASGGYTGIYRPHQKPIESSLSAYTLILYGTKKSDWPDSKATKTTTTTSRSATLSTKSTTTLKSKVPTKTPPSISDTKEPCIVHKRVGTGCLVCRLPSKLDPLTGNCVKKCGSGRFAAHERVNMEGEREKVVSSQSMSSEGQFEMEEEESFEDEERFYHGYVCRPCSKNCHHCLGPDVCVQCVNGNTFLDINSPCVPVHPGVLPNDEDSNSKNFYFFSFAIVFVAVVLFSILFCFFRSRKSPFACCGKSTVAYHYIANAEGNIARVYPDDSDFEYHDDPTADILDNKHQNGGMLNGSVFTTNTVVANGHFSTESDHKVLSESSAALLVPTGD